LKKLLLISFLSAAFLLVACGGKQEQATAPVEAVEAEMVAEEVAYEAMTEYEAEEAAAYEVAEAAEYAAEEAEEAAE